MRRLDLDLSWRSTQISFKIVQERHDTRWMHSALGHVRLKDTNWACVIAGTPWGVSFGEAKGCVRFHYVSRGSCWLSIEKSSQPRIALSGGDLAVLPQGQGHTTRDQPRRSSRRFDEVLRRPASAPGVIHHVKVGGVGAETSLIHGAFMIDDPFETPMLATLPSVIRITPDAGEAVPSFLPRQASSQRRHSAPSIATEIGFVPDEYPPGTPNVPLPLLRSTLAFPLPLFATAIHRPAVRVRIRESR